VSPKQHGDDTTGYLETAFEGPAYLKRALKFQHLPLITKPMCVLSRHCGVLVRRLGLVIGVLVAIATAASTGAIALDEQRMAIPNGAPDAAKADVQEQTAPKSEEGAVIRIPGLGKLGTLPKMDFGLELLYGAAEDSKVNQNSEPPANGPDSSRDLMIHGSMKHRF
jgi:hypothetical protein